MISKKINSSFYKIKIYKYPQISYQYEYIKKTSESNSEVFFLTLIILKITLLLIL